MTEWPRLEMGNSSVTPCTSPSTTAWKYVSTGSREGHDEELGPIRGLEHQERILGRGGHGHLEPAFKGAIRGQRFAAQARVSTILVGLSGFYMLYCYEQWGRIADPRFWWLDAMIGLWAIFTIMLFVAEPLFLQALFDARARRDPDGAFHVALYGHRVLSLVAVVTVLGAVGGAHGLFSSR